MENAGFVPAFFVGSKAMLHSFDSSPCKAGGGWEGGLLLLALAKSNPSPTLPCFAGEGANAPSGFAFVVDWVT